MKKCILALMLFVTPVQAADFGKVMVTDEGKPICMVTTKENEDCPSDKTATLVRLVKAALYTSFPDEQNLSGEEKYKRAEIAQGLTGANELKLKSEDIVTIKKVVAKTYGPLIVYQAWQELER